MSRLIHIQIYIFLFSITIMIQSCGVYQSVQDRRDRAALRRLFDLPSSYELVSYDGYPSMVGFGQREGLEISAQYELSSEQFEEFLRDASDRGWEPLPIPEIIDSRILYQGLPVPMDLLDGLYYCHTAGDNVLHAKATHACIDVNVLSDIILGILDASTRRLYVVVRAGY